MKVLQQVLMDDGHTAGDASTKDGSSFLGKYIIGAKNNFIGFNSRQDEKNASPKVTVHNGEEGVDKEKVDSDTKQESAAQQNQVDECGAEKVTDWDVVKMEEGRVKVELGDEETENKDKVEADRNEVKEEVGAGTSLNHVGEKLKAEATQDEAEKRRGGIQTGAKVTETTPELAESIKVNSEKTDINRVVNKFKDIELQEKKVESKWMMGRKIEHNVADKSSVREMNVKPGAKKTIPSPTGSSSSQDTGFGSQEGEGSIDGMLVRP